MIITFPFVLGFLKDARRRLRCLEALAGLINLLSAFLVMIIASVIVLIVAGHLGFTRGVFLVIFGASCLWIVFYYGIRPWMRWINLDSVAREIEKRFDQENLTHTIGSLELISAIQLDQKLPQLMQDPSMSPDLVKAYLEQLADRLKGCDLSRLIKIGRLYKPWFFSVMAIGMLFVAGTFLTDKTWAAFSELMFLAPDRVTDDVEPAGPSWVGDISLVYHYPVYSGRKVFRVEGTNGAIFALAGTRVILSCQTDRDIDRAILVQDDLKLPLAIQNNKSLSGELLVTQNTQYRFELKDTHGRVCTDNKNYKIKIEPDAIPKVVLNQPKRDMVVREKDIVKLSYEARDDIGLKETRLVFRVTRRKHQVKHKTLKTFSSYDVKIRRRVYPWDLSVLKLQPGDVVQYHIEAYDHDTVSGPKAGRSASLSLKVFSADLYHRELLDQIQAHWEDLLQLLADVLVVEDRVKETKNASIAEPYQKVFETTEAYTRQSGKLLAGLEKDWLAEMPLVKALSNNYRDLSEAQKTLERLLRKPVSTKGLANRWSRHRKQRINLLERDVLYLEDILDLIRLEDLDRIGGKLASLSEDLEKLAREYANTPDEQTRKEIEAALAHIKQEITKLLARQQEIIKEVRDEYLNPEELERMLSKSDMLGGADLVQKLLMEGKIEAALQAIERLRDKLSSFRSAVAQSKLQYGAGKYDRLSVELQELFAELNGIIGAQERIATATGRLNEKLMEIFHRRKQAMIKRTFDLLRGRLGKLIERISGIPQKELEPYRSQFLNEALDQSRLLDQVLRVMDLMGSREMAHKLELSTSRLERVLEAMAAVAHLYYSNKSEKFRGYQKAGAFAYSQAKKISRALEALLPDPDKLLNKKQLGGLDLLGKRQADLQKRLRILKSRMQAIDESAPLFGAHSIKSVARSSGSMRQASRNLKLHQPQSAYPHQRFVLQELEKLMRAFEANKQQMAVGMPLPLGSAVQMGGMPTGGFGSEMDQDEVEVPGPEDYRPPEAFRKALLEGMRDPVPEQVEPQVKKYYEELVK